MDPLAIGQTINGRYRLVAIAGAGGMGQVYRAEQLPLGRRVALKVLRARGAAREIDPAFQRRFFLEASLCAKLSHPNIVTVYDYGEIEGLAGAYFIAMEFLEGETLHQRLRARGGALGADEALALGVQIARGLREAHRHGIVHRDLKPSNVMLVPDDELGVRAKIVDFGLVKQVDGDGREELTREGSFLGSPRYMAPEQIEGHGVDARTDLYALGVILYQCLAGRVPFEGDSAMRVFVGHLSAPVPAMKARNPACDVPEPLERFVRRLLEKSSYARPASADEVAAELRALQATLGPRRGARGGARLAAETLAGEPSPNEPSASLPGASMARVRPLTLQPPPRRGALARWLAVAGAAVVLAGGAVAYARWRAHDAQGAGNARMSAASAGATVVRAAPGASNRQLTIESRPPGAVVSENDQTLGLTPLVLALDGNQSAPRRFIVQAPGFRPYTLVQSPTQHDVRIRADLAAADAAEPALVAPVAPTTLVAPAASAHAPLSRGAASREGRRGGARPVLSIHSER